MMGLNLFVKRFLLTQNTNKCIIISVTPSLFNPFAIFSTNSHPNKSQGFIRRIDSPASGGVAGNTQDTKAKPRVSLRQPRLTASECLA